MPRSFASFHKSTSAWCARITTRLIIRLDTTPRAKITAMMIAAGAKCPSSSVCSLRKLSPIEIIKRGGEYQKASIATLLSRLTDSFLCTKYAAVSLMPWPMCSWP